MAHINLASATNKKFTDATLNDVQIYSSTSTPTFFVGASNAKNYLKISPTQTSTSNLYVSGQATSSNATISNLVITGAIWSSNENGLQQYSVGGGVGGSISSNLNLKSLTSTVTTTELLNVNGELIINGGPPKSNVTMCNATFSNVSADYITAFKDLTVSSGGTVTLPSGSIIGTTLDPASSSVLSNLVLSNLTVSNIVKFASNAIPWTAINSNTVPPLGVQDSSQLTYTNSTIPWNALTNIPSLASNVPNSISWTSLDPNTFSQINYVSGGGGGAGGGAPTEIPNMTVEGGDLIISSRPFDGSSTGTYLSNSIPWTALNSNTFKDISYVSGGGGAPTEIPNMTIEGGDLIITSQPYDGSTTGTYLSNSIPWTAINSNSSITQFTASNVLLSNLTISQSVSFPTNFNINTTGSVTAASFSGSGTGLTNIPGAQVTGTVANATNATTLVNNPTLTGTITGGTFSGTHTGDGSGLTNLAVANITGGKTGSGGLVLSNAPTFVGTVTAGTFSGSGAGLTNIPGAQVTGTVANATTATTAGTCTGNAATATTLVNNPTLTGTITGGTFSGTHTGDGSGLTNLAITNITGGNTGTGGLVLSNAPVMMNAGNLGTFSNSGLMYTNQLSNMGDARVSGVLYSASHSNTGLLISGGLSNYGGFCNVGPISALGQTITAGTFSGSGTGLTNIPGAQVTGTVANATNATTASTCTGNAATATTLVNNPTLTGTITGGTFLGTHTGDGSGLTNLAITNITGGNTGTGGLVRSNAPTFVGTVNADAMKSLSYTFLEGTNGANDKYLFNYSAGQIQCILGNYPAAMFVVGKKDTAGTLQTLAYVDFYGNLSCNGSISAQSNVICSGNISAQNMGMFRNRIINGDMRIFQRDNTFTVTIGNKQICDRFMVDVVISSLSLTCSSDTNVPSNQSFTNSLKIVVGTVGTVGSTNYALLLQRIEGINIPEWVPGTTNKFTFSFWAYSSVPGTYSAGVTHVGSGNSGNHQFTSTFTLTANTWKFVQFTMSPPSGLGANGSLTGSWVNCYIVLESGSSYQTNTVNTWGGDIATSGTTYAPFCSTLGAIFYTTGWQFEKGNIATPFEFRPFQIELDLCHRYCYGLGYNIPADNNINSYIAKSSSTFDALISFPKMMRDKPSVISGYLSYISGGGAANTNFVNSISSLKTGMTFALLTATCGSTGGALITGNYLTWIGNGKAAVIFDAELV